MIIIESYLKISSDFGEEYYYLLIFNLPDVFITWADLLRYE